MDVLNLRAVLSLDTKDYENGLSNSSTQASKFGTAMKSSLAVVTAAVAAATTAVVAFAKSSINAGMDFDSSMSQVAATMGKSMAEMEEEVGTVDLAWGTFNGNLREFAQEMGKNTAFSATEAADALNYMALAGYDVQTSMEMLPNVLNLAAAGGFDLARASDMVTDTQTAFGISLERTTQMVDEMAKAASTGNTSVEQLGDAFLVVGGLAQELNGGFVTLADGTRAPVDGVQELEIALTAMANAGVKGSEAGTHMRNMLLKLSSPTDDGADALERLGVAIFNDAGEMRSLSDIFGDLNEGLSELTQEQKVQAIADIFNARDIASSEALLNAIEQDWDAIGESILDAQGSAQKMADTQLDNLAGDITLFKSALEGAKIAVSDKLTPSLREFVKFGTSGLSKLTDAFQKGGLSGAMQAFGQILADGLNMIINKAPEFVSAGMGLLKALGDGLIENLPMIIDASVEIVVELVQGILESLPMLIQAGLDIIVGLETGIVEHLPELIPVAIDTILTIVDALIENIDMLVDAAVAIMTGLADAIIEATPQLLEKVPEIVVKLVEAIVENAPKIIEAVINILTKIAEQLVQYGKEFVNKVVQNGRDILSALVNWLSELPTKMAYYAGYAIGQFIKFFQELPENLRNLLVKAFEKIKQFGTDLINKAPEIARNFKEKLISGIRELPERFREIGSNIITGIWNGISAGWDWLVGKVKSLAQSLLQGAKDALGIASPSKAFAKLGLFSAEGFGEGWEKEFAKVKKFITDDLKFEASVSSGTLSASLSAGGKGISINIESMSVRDDMDIQKISKQLYTMITQSARSRGLGGAYV